MKVLSDVAIILMLEFAIFGFFSLIFIVYIAYRMFKGG